MKIEEAIHQSEFVDEWHKATVNLLYTTNWLENQIKAVLKPYDVTMQQFNVLRILRGQHPEPISINQIRDRMLDRMSDASRIVERMVKKGWVERKTCSSDKRLVDVVILPLGLNVLKEIQEHQPEMNTFISNLSAVEANQLNQLLDKLRQ